MSRFHRTPLAAVARALFVLAGATACAAVARADEPLVTDRPDFVESSMVVDRGHWQLETSFASQLDKDAAGTRVRALTTPTLLRFGVRERLELRVETDGWTRVTTQPAGAAAARETGFSDVSLGVKWHQQDGDEASHRPSIAWLVHADIDSGSGAFRGQGVRPSLRMVAEWELPHDWSLGVMPGVFADRDD